jgi:dihydrofolate synthase/folylpolyglutamate synthase
MRSLEQWLAHQERAHPQPIDMGLTRLERVLDRLRWRQPGVPVITVAGTNGKGSVVAYCAAMLRAAGYRVGTFTSPHLRDYRERIRVNGAQVDADALIRAFERIEEDCTDGAQERVSLTFFEYNALAALLIFESQRLDAWVLEVGMGGRLDAVNVVDPSVAVVVSIGLDHQEFLGPTLDSIAREKAGIFRPGVPAVLGGREMPPVLADIAHEIGAPLKRPGFEYEFAAHADRWHYRGPLWDLRDLPAPALLGDAQFGNAAAAIAALEELAPRLPLAVSAVARGLRTVRLAGRFQVIAAAGRPTWILDVAHNPDAACVLAANLRARPIAGRTLAVCGILADKDAAAVAHQLRDCIDEWWLCPTQGARGTTSAELAARIAPQVGVRHHQAQDIGTACAAASAAALAQDRIVVFGSFHTVGPAMNWLEAHAMLSPPDLPEYTAPPNGHE